MESYSISKIAAETMVQYTSKRLGIPTVIARLSVPYGDTFGWPFFHVMMLEHGMAIPVHTDAPSQYNPLNLDDIVASLPYLLASASTPANVVNWGGDEVVSVEEWCGLIGELIDKPVNFEFTDASVPPLILDVGKLNDLGFHSSVTWRDGITRLVQTSRPDLVAILTHAIWRGWRAGSVPHDPAPKRRTNERESAEGGAAVDVDGLAGDPRRLVGRQEHAGEADVVGRAGAADGDLLRQRVDGTEFSGCMRPSASELAVTPSRARSPSRGGA